jgi:hypothetical protein
MDLRSRLGGNRSSLFYVVAKIGDGHRPLGVVLLEIAEFSTPQAVILACLRLINIFSDLENRAPILAEISLAQKFYKGKENVPAIGIPASKTPSNSSLDGRQWITDAPEFPFILTCLFLGVDGDPARAGSWGGNVRTEKLGSVDPGNRLDDGMVVVDISDLDRIGYGIIGFRVQNVSRNNIPSYQWQLPRTVPRIHHTFTTQPTPEQNQPREILSAAQFVAKFASYLNSDADRPIPFLGYSWEGAVDILGTIPLIDAAVLGSK